MTPEDIGEQIKREPVQTTNRAIETTETAFEVVEAVRSLDGVRVTELAAELDMVKSTVHRHLTTLHELGYLVKKGEQYYVSLKFVPLGEAARTRKRSYSKLRPKVAALAEQTNESAQFLVPEHGRAVYVHRETGRNAIDTPNSSIGDPIPLHASAAGKAIFACYPPETVDEIADRTGLEPLTDNTITDREALREELAEIRSEGYSVNDEEAIEGVYAVGVPIKRTDGTPLGALSISGPAHRLRSDQSERELADTLLETANELELNIAYS